MNINRQKKRIVSWKVILILLVLVGACVVIYMYLQPKQPGVSNSDTPKPQSDQNVSNGPATDRGTTSTPTKQPSTATKPTAPTGTFASNHRPNLSGQPAPSNINSTCITTPGATCMISFKKDGVVKSLPEKLVPSDGVASWDWSLSDIGLTAGSWSIVATAKNGDLSTTTSDNIPLEVSP